MWKSPKPAGREQTIHMVLNVTWPQLELTSNNSLACEPLGSERAGRDWAAAKDRLEQFTQSDEPSCGFILEFLLEAKAQIPPSDRLPSEGIQPNDKWS